jgi:hypothetical protein
MMTISLDWSIEQFIATNTVPDVLSTQAWRSSLGASALELMATSLRARESVRQRVVAEFLGTETMRENETLRSMALRIYGSADAWTVIADANGLVSSLPPVGTLLLIPRYTIGSNGSMA